MADQFGTSVFDSLQVVFLSASPVGETHCKTCEARIVSNIYIYIYICMYNIYIYMTATYKKASWLFCKSHLSDIIHCVFARVRGSDRRLLGWCGLLGHSTYLYIYASIYLSMHQSMHLSIYLSIYLYIYVSI